MTEKLSFKGMLDRLYEAENELIELSPEEIKALLGDLKGKIDGIHDWLMRLDSEADRIDGEIKKFQAKKKSLKNAKERFRTYIGETMANNETEELFGATYNVTAKPRTFIKVKKNIEISTMDYAAFKDLGVIEREYKINATALKREVKNNKALEKFTEKETKPVVKFNTRKG